MKFLYFTDLHIKGINPGKRKDVYSVAILKKLMEIRYVIDQEKVNFVVIGGDLFDLPKVSNQLLGEVAKIIKSWKVRVFVVPGNHDVYGQNISTLPHTSLGILVNAGVVSIMSRDTSPVYVGKRNDPNYPLVAFTGQEYYPEIDTGVNDDYQIERSVADYNVLVAHGMLLEKPFHPDVPFTLIQDVTTDANLVLSGHYHPDETNVVEKNVHFIKPRSAGRLEATKHNIDHMPQYVIVDIEKQNGVVTMTSDVRDFTWAEVGSKIFDYEGQIEEKIYKNNLKEFKQQIRDIDLTKSVDLPQMIKTIAGADPDVTFEHIESALKYLIASEKTTTDKTLNGYVASNLNSYIEEVEITNFQSHGNTVAKFSPSSLNALVGESNNGKTAIMRAINWCLYNEPKGNDFIKEGEKFVSVSITFSNGKKLTRRRTNSETGYYEIADVATGVVDKYAKFGLSVPIEVSNVHQMPKVILAKEPVSLNVAQQLDGAFMLSWSAAERAAAIGKITKTDVADNAILDVSRDIVNLQREVKSSEKDITTLGGKLKDFDYLTNEKLVLDQVEAVMKLIADRDKRAEALAQLSCKFDAALIDIGVATHAINNTPDTKQVDKLIAEIDEKSKSIDVKSELINKHCSIMHDIDTAEKQIAKCTQVIDGLADISQVAPILDQISLLDKRSEAKAQQLNAYNAVMDQIKRIEASIEKGNAYVANIHCLSEEEIDALDKQLGRVQYLQETKDLYDQRIAYINKASNAVTQESTYLEQQESLIKSTKEEYREVLLEAGQCPICGNNLTEHCNFEL